MMGYDEGTAQRLRDVIGTAPGLSERHMFGGISFLIDGNMCCGVIDHDLVVRVGPEHYDMALTEPYARAMDFTGRPLRGFVYIAPDGFSDESDLEQWIARAARFVRTLPAKKKS
jgi:TfoX/Sxy family transcriptional regulator of competence genes